MKLNYFLTMLLFISVTNLFGQSKYYVTNLSWSSIHNGRKVLQKINGQYVLACEVKDNNTNEWNSYVTVIDSFANIVDNFSDVDENYQSGIFDMSKQGDNFVAVGVFVPPINTVARSYAIKLKSNNELNKYLFGDTAKHTIAHACVTTLDNGLLLAGNVDQIGSIPKKLNLIRIDSNDVQIWETTYDNFTKDNTYEDIIALPNGTFYGLATVRDDYWQQANVALLHISSTGIPINAVQEYNLGGRDLARCLIATNDGGLMFSASSYPSSNDPTEVVQYLYKLNSLAETQWIKDTDFVGAVISSIVQLADSTYVVAGSDFSSETNYLQGFIAKLDVNGSILWRRSYGGNSDEYIYDLINNKHDLSGQNGYVMCGRTESSDLGVPLGNANVYFLKTNCMGLLTEPLASFSTSNEGNMYSFANTSQFVYPDSIDGGHYLWAFGDGSTSAELNPTHTYTQDGVYTITLTAIVCNDTSTIQQTVCVGSPAFAPLFSAQTNDLSVSLSNQSTGVVENQGSFIWSFGDGSLPVQTQDTLPQQHSYTQSGIYTIDLQAIVCNDTLLYRQTIEVIALASPQPHASPQPPPKEGELQGLFSIMPNPANGYLTITQIATSLPHSLLSPPSLLPSPSLPHSLLPPPSEGAGGGYEFVLYNMLGQTQIKIPLLTGGAGVVSTQVNLANIPTGVYLYQIINNNKNQTLQYGKVSVLH